MSEREHRKISELFLLVADMDPTDRPAFLESACNGDQQLRAQVESLLEHDERLPGLLDTGSMQLRAKEELQAAPSWIGGYRIMEQIGEGGMGVVYRAQQQEPIRRQVALKLIKRGLETEQVLKRFDSERQVLALMDHPGIARVLDSGATDQGRPYFAMEYVDGEPITSFCDANRLDVDERLRLFLKVCEAVEHAHQNAIIHRDLKPSNVLITRVSDRPVPKIIDFGIAKALTPELLETDLTEIGQIVGTPVCMSPEQASLDPVPVDTRADVYSLGAILYELLAGSVVFEHTGTGASSASDLYRRIRDEDPQLPGTRISELGTDSGEVALARRTRPRALVRRLRGDLDCIVMKTLEKQRSRRYASVAALTADLRRHLNGEPIEARPRNSAYRLGKLIRKHRTAAAVVGLLIPLLIGFSATMAVQASRIARERDRAEEISDFLVRFYDIPFHVVERHGLPTAESVLLDSAAKIRRLDDRPRLQARLNHQMGRVLGSVGQTETAQPLLESAREKLVEQEGPESPRAISALHDLAMVRWLERDPGAEALLTEAVTARRQTLGDHDPGTLRAMIDLGHMHKRARRIAESLPWFELAVEGTRALYGDGHEETKIAASLLASTYLDLGRFDEAGAMLEELIPNFEGFSPEVYIAIYNLACVRAMQGRRDEALATLQRAVDRGFWSGIRTDGFWEQYRDDPEFIRLAKLSELRYDVVRDRVEYMAGVYRRQGRLEEAADLYETVLDEVPLATEARSVWELSLASVYIDQGRYAEAEPLVLSRLAALRGSFATLTGLANTMWFLVQTRLGQGDLEGALAALDEQETVYATLNVDSPYNLAVRAALRGDSEEVFVHLRTAVLRGFADVDKLHRELAFRSLQGSADFDTMIDEVRRRSWVPSDLSLDIWFRLGVMPAIAENQSATRMSPIWLGQEVEEAAEDLVGTGRADKRPFRLLSE